MVYNPITDVGGDPGFTVTQWADLQEVKQPAICSNNLVESIVLDHKDGTLLTLINWTNAPVKGLEVYVRMKDAPKTVRTVSGQRNLAFTHKDGIVTFRLDLAEADYVVLRK